MSTDSKGSIDAEDVDDLVGIAAEMMNHDEGRLDREDLNAVGRELDIPPEYMERARVELARRRAEAARVAAAKKALRTRIGIGAAAAAALATVIVGFAYSSTASDLHALHEDVEARAAQVRNVEARQQSVTARLGDREPTPDVDAELIGADNRVRVETQRYGTAAADYNEAVSGAWASWVAGVAGLPGHVPSEPR